MNTSNRSSAINRRHWIAAAVLTALICGTSFGEEAEVKTNDQKLLDLCEDPEATPEAIEAFLKAGANIEARDKYGNTPLMLAAITNKNPEVIESLLKAGADVTARDERGGTPLTFAAQYNSNPEVIEDLLKAGADIDARDKDGKTPLMRAVKWGAGRYTPLVKSNSEVIEALLTAGADVKAKDKEEKTAVDYAREHKKIYKTRLYWKLNDLQYE